MRPETATSRADTSRWRRGLATVAVAAVAASLPALALAAESSPTAAPAPAAEAAAAPDEPDATTTGDTAADRLARQVAQLDGTASRLTDILPTPRVSATGWIVYDATADEPIAGEEPARARAIASLAKLMTAVLVVERTDPDELVTIPAAVDRLPVDAARMDARPGERWPAGDLLRGMLAHSANDAAMALAAHVGTGSEATFVELMNQRAQELGLDRTQFGSATGLDLAGNVSSSTPADMVTLTEVALRDPDIRAAVRSPRVTLARPGSEDTIELRNRHPLVGAYEGVDGGKTGFTDAAGYMLVTHHVDPESTGELIVVTFASSSEATRASDTRALLDWARPFRTNALLVEGGVTITSVPVVRSGREVELFACDDLVVSVRAGQELRLVVDVPRALVSPVDAGDEVGELRIEIAGHAPPAADEDDDAAAAAASGSVPLCSKDTIRVEGRLEQARSWAGEYRTAWRAGVDELEDAWSSIS